MFTRTGADIAVGATGDITNVSLMEGIPVEWRPAITEAGLGNGSSGRVASICINSLGQLRLNALRGTTNLAAGQMVSVTGVYPINPL